MMIEYFTAPELIGFLILLIFKVMFHSLSSLAAISVFHFPAGESFALTTVFIDKANMAEGYDADV